MEKNVGATDKKIRYGIAALAGVLATRAGLDTDRGKLLGAVALIAGATAASGTCPLWKALGVNTAESPATGA
jgi:hypothetical protein